MEFSIWLKNYRKECGLSQQELADWLNAQAVVEKKLDNHSIFNWENKRTLPDYKTFLAIAYCAGLADPYLTFLGATHSYRLNDEGRRKLDEYARLLEDSPRYAVPAAKPAGRAIPFYELPVSAGLGQFLDSDRFELREVDGTVPHDAEYAVPVAGDSMEPRFVDKQWIFVKEQHTLEEGDIGVFLYDGESYCKVYSTGTDGCPVLRSLNPAYEPIRAGLIDTFRVLGKVVGG